MSSAVSRRSLNLLESFELEDLEGDIVKFWNLLKEINHESQDCFSQFEKKWNESLAFNSQEWYQHRSATGTGPLFWAVSLRYSLMARGNTPPALFENLAMRMMELHPECLLHTCKSTVYEGQTILHVVTANGDMLLFDAILASLSALPSGQDVINQRATGSFFSELLHIPPELGFKVLEDGVSALDTALIAAIDDGAAIKMAGQLLDAGAEIAVWTQDGQKNGTILHHIAKCRWRHFMNVDAHMSGTRTRAALDLILSWASQLPPPSTSRSSASTTVQGQLLDERNHLGLTAVQVAAMLGNEVVLLHCLKTKIKVMASFGCRRAAFLPLEILDCGKDVGPSVLELLVLHQHRHVETVNVVYHLLEEKWCRFGFFCIMFEAAIMISIVLLVTISSLTQSFTHEIREDCRFASIWITTISTCFVLVQLFRTRKCEWWRRMAWLPNDNKLSIWSVGTFRNLLVMVMSSIIMVAQHLQVNGHFPQEVNAKIDAALSVILFLLWISLLRFMRVFEKTGTVIQAIPEILQRDFVPWIMLYLLLVLGFAGAIRISVKHLEDDQKPVEDIVLGNFFRVALTLEEATHGPDVQWREAVTKRSFMSAVFFLSFLWVVTIVMLNLLIGMFSDTFEVIRRRSRKVVLHNRAIEVISHEKLLPSCLHWLVGGELGVAFPNLYKSSISMRLMPQDGEADEKTPLLGKTSSTRRWIQVAQTETSEKWSELLDEEVDAVHGWWLDSA